MKQQSYKSLFELEKWYLDLVSENGDVFIFYQAKLRWRSVYLYYKSKILLSQTGEQKVATRFLNVKMPQQKNEIIEWSDSWLQLNGSWHALQSSIHAQIVQSNEGGLQWNCHQPSSFVELTIEGKQYKGLGYAEQLFLTMLPWHISMDSLRWGRYVTKDDSIVWIELRGKEQKSFAWYNGQQVQSVDVSENRVLLPSLKLSLEFNDTKIIRSHKSIANAVKRIAKYIPGFTRLVPLKFLMADETKWLSKGLLIKDTNLISKGWVIHELVTFNN
jgi:hypothetical protein